MDNLKELFDRLPISKAGVAEGVGEDRAWLHHRLTGYRNWQPGEKEKVIKYLNEMGKELSKIKLK